MHNAVASGLKDYAMNLQIQTESGNGFFNPAYSGVGSTFNDIAAATCTNFTQALSELNQFVSNVNALLVAPAAYPFVFAITPTSLVAQPNRTSVFKLQMQNQSDVTQTYNLVTSGIPAGVGPLCQHD